jgi:RHS repeat-associated protein
MVVQTQQSMVGAFLRSSSATYTLTSKPATVTDANGNTASFSYDVLDRILSTKDAMGRLTNYGYDALGRQVSIANTSVQAAPLLQKSYTPDGLLVNLTDANNHATGFAYDRFNRLATTTYPLGSAETLTYDADGNVTSRQTRAGDTISYAYDTLNRLKTKTPPSPAPVVSYAYDLAGRLTGVSDTSAAVTAAVPPSGPSVQYATSLGYDVMNRPTAVNWTPAPSAAVPAAGSVTFGHAYNKANQRIGQTVTDNTWFNYPAATPGTVSYTADALNRYTAVGAVSPTYDVNSNLTSDGTFTLGYDAENRLTSAGGAGNTVAYSYDAQGRRKTRTVNGATTVFVTDAGNREVLEYDGASGAIQRWYAYGAGANDVVNQSNVAAGTRAALIPDIQGSVIASLDSASGSLSRIGYLPYGKSTSAGPFGYTGQRIDPETGGLYYYRARHYSPAWGRFLQADPTGYAGGVNLYGYVGNDPLNGTDPLGLYTLQIGFAGSWNLPAGAAIPAGFGIAIDTSGHVGIYGYLGAAANLGASVNAGVSIQVSNAQTISNLTGVFLNASAHGGAGFGGSVDYFRGPSENGQVSGAGITIGPALGAAVAGGGTNTWLYAPFGDGSAPANPSPVASAGTSTQQVATDLSSTPNPGSTAGSTLSGSGISSTPGK